MIHYLHNIRVRLLSFLLFGLVLILVAPPVVFGQTGVQTATVRGFIMDVDGRPIKNLSSNAIQILAYNDAHWKEGMYDASSGSYTMQLPSGEWFVFVEPLPATGFMTSDIGMPVGVTSAGGIIERPITLRRYDGVIAGEVKENGGSYLGRVLVNIRNLISGEIFSHEAENGSYQLFVPAGTYEVNVFPRRESRVMPDATQPVTVAKGEFANIALAMKPTDVEIKGVVAIPSSVAITAADVVVRASSETGRFTETAVNAKGVYTLALKTPDTWRIVADAVGMPEGRVYRSEEKVLAIGTQNQILTQNLSLAPTATVLPKSVSKSFRGSDGITMSLSNGAVVSVPPNAFPSDETFSIGVIPSTSVPQKGLTLAGFAYQIKIKNPSGELVTHAPRYIIQIPVVSDPGVKESFLRMLSFDPMTSAWRTDGNYVVRNGKITSLTNSSFLAGFVITLPQPEQPTSSGGGGGGGVSAPTPQKPTPPSLVSATPKSDRAITITAFDLSRSIGESYRIERSQSLSGEFQKIAENLSELMFENGGLNASTQYCYRFISTDLSGTGDSSPSEVACAITLADKTFPVITSSVTVNANQSVANTVDIVFTTDEPTSSQLTIGPAAVENPNFVLVHNFTAMPVAIGITQGEITITDAAGNKSAALSFVIPSNLTVTPAPSSGGTAVAGVTPETPSVQSQPQSQSQPPAPQKYIFTRNLTVGSRGEDVRQLQILLINLGLLKIAAPTTFFGQATRAALVAYQAANRISPAVGYFGPLTRNFVNNR